MTDGAGIPRWQIFDFDGAMDRLAGRAEYLERVINNFIADTPARLAELQTALDGRSYQDALRLAHALNGAAAMIGAARLEKQALALERALIEPASADIETLHNDVIAEFEACKSAIESFAWTGRS